MYGLEYQYSQQREKIVVICFHNSELSDYVEGERGT